jgi:hypothetical protein
MKPTPKPSHKKLIHTHDPQPKWWKAKRIDWGKFAIPDSKKPFDPER